LLIRAVMLCSSTTMPGQTRSSSSCLLTSRSRRDERQQQVESAGAQRHGLAVRAQQPLGRADREAAEAQRGGGL